MLTVSFVTFIAFIALVAAIMIFAPRPKLDPRAHDSQVPSSDPATLSRWLQDYEAGIPHITAGAEATIAWADGETVQDYCFLYIHGFSATRRETAPLTERIANEFGGNVIYARLAGHGLEQHAMEAPAEEWLRSTQISWDIAKQIGRKVIIIATSTGAPLALWLNQVNDGSQPAGYIFLSPNFKIRSPFRSLLTWPWAATWIPFLLGKEHAWEPENELAARFWTHRYSTLAIIEMQKVVDWVRSANIKTKNIPLTTIYMNGDPTIDHEAAIAFHQQWDASYKQLHRVTIDEDNPQHVFVGDITAPGRVDWCVGVCAAFVTGIPG